MNSLSVIASLKKTDSLSSRSHPLSSIVFCWSGTSWAPSATMLEFWLTWSYIHSHRYCELMWAAVLSFPACCLNAHARSLWHLWSSWSFFHNDPWALGEGVYHRHPIKGWASHNLIPALWPVWVSVVAICCKNKLLWWVTGDGLI